MKRVYWVSPGELAGRHGPAMVPWDLEELYRGGFRAIVSLSDEVDEAAIAARGFYHLPNYLPPLLPLIAGLKRRLIVRALPALAFIDAQLAAGRPTLVHCYAGKDRTGMVLVGYLVRYRGYGLEQAMAMVRAARPDAMSAPGYEATAVKLAGWERDA